MTRTDRRRALRRAVPAPIRARIRRHHPAPVRRPAFPRPPQRPIGVKFELTHRCNLLCSFCYTDSPAKTLGLTHDFGPDDWAAVVDECIELGIVEAVVTGGEPLLRKRLTLDVLRRLDAAGVGTVLTTNGWFLDDDTADALVPLRHLTVGVSIDGLTPELHDAGRGVARSWERAVAALDRLLARGVPTRVNHVVTPTNEEHVAGFLDAFWDFGVRTMRVTSTLTTGGATRAGRWDVDEGRLRQALDGFRRTHEGSERIVLRNPEDLSAIDHGEVPQVLLIRPDGAVVVDSVRPFSFGHARVDGVAAAWSNLRDAWDSGRFESFKDLAAGHVPYRDHDLVVAGSTVRLPEPPATTRTIPIGLPEPVGCGDAAAAVAHLETLRDRRLLVRVPHRWAGDADGVRVVRTASGHKHVLRAESASVLDEFAEPCTVDDVRSRRSLSSTSSAAADLRRTVDSLVDRGLLAHPSRAACLP